MYASNVKLREFRSFQNVEVKLGKYLTCISGQNGVGKSQILALIGNSGQITKKIGETLQGYPFRADWSEIVKGDPNHDQLNPVHDAVTIEYKDLPDMNSLDQDIYPEPGFVQSLGFRTFWQNEKVSIKNAILWKEKHRSINAREHVDELARRAFKKVLSQLKPLSPEQNKFIEDVNELVDQKATLEYLSDFFNKQTAFDKKELGSISVSVPYRLRIVPQKQDDVRMKEAKLPWPTYYLGLSRLYPSGEAESPEIDDVSLSDNDNKYLQNMYNKIFSTNEEDFELSSIRLSESPRKHGLGVENNKFGPLGNSNGQDNLNQILAAMLSFKKLNESLKENYLGGVLLIDELDASLHPAAQNKLLDFMAEQTRKYHYQIIFTTHSLSMIEHFSQLKQQLTPEDTPDFMLSYLTNGRGFVESKEAPSISWIHNELLVSYNSLSRSARSIPIITEDDAATTFLTKVIDLWCPEMRLDFLNLSTGWTNLVTLISKDFNYFGKWITMLDADVSESKLQNKLNGSLFRFEPTASSKSVDITDILKLPNLLPDSFDPTQPELSKSDFRPYIELELWLFLESLPPEDAFYSDPQLARIAYYKRLLIEDGPFSGKYSNGSAESKVKAWYKDNLSIVNIAWSYFIDRNKEKIKPTIQLLVAKYNSIVTAYYSDLNTVKLKVK